MAEFPLFYFLSGWTVFATQVTTATMIIMCLLLWSCLVEVVNLNQSQVFNQSIQKGIKHWENIGQASWSKFPTLPPKKLKAPLMRLFQSICCLHGGHPVLFLFFCFPPSQLLSQEVGKCHHQIKIIKIAIIIINIMTTTITIITTTRYSINLITTALVSDCTSERSRSARFSLVQVFSQKICIFQISCRMFLDAWDFVEILFFWVLWLCACSNIHLE